MFRANQNQKLKDADKGSIIALTNMGLSISAISRQIGCSRATVRLWQQRYADENNVKRKVGSGGKRATTAVDDARIVDCVRQQPITTARKIAGKYNTPFIIISIF